MPVHSDFLNVHCTSVNTRMCGVDNVTWLCASSHSDFVNVHFTTVNTGMCGADNVTWLCASSQ